MKKTVINMHYHAGYRQLTFSKNIDLPNGPFYNLIIYDTNSEGEGVAVDLADIEGVRETKIYYNTFLKRYEVEVSHVVHERRVKGHVEELIGLYKEAGWKCETLKPDIEEYTNYVEGQTN